jgi:hypothetical protein
MLRAATGVMDGISLSHLLPGLSYDVNAATGFYLTTNGYAEELASSNTALIVPIDDPQEFSDLLGGVSVTTPLDRAEEAPRAPRKKKRPRRRH